jgi:hypothetical protein
MKKGMERICGGRKVKEEGRLRRKEGDEAM